MQGLGTIGGFKLEVEDRGDQGDAALDATMKKIQGMAYKDPALTGIFSSYQINVPQLFVDLDRTKAQQLGIDVQDIFDTMQVYLGSLYVNDFNKFGRTYQVIAQADKDLPLEASTTSSNCKRPQPCTGQMVPLGSVVLTMTRNQWTGKRFSRYNGFRAADLNGNAGAWLFERPGAGGDRANRCSARRCQRA